MLLRKVKQKRFYHKWNIAYKTIFCNPFWKWNRRVLRSFTKFVEPIQEIETEKGSESFPISNGRVLPDSMKTIRSGINAKKMVRPQGLEPWTQWLRVICSTDWAMGAHCNLSDYPTNISSFLKMSSSFFYFFTNICRNTQISHKNPRHGQNHRIFW